MIVFFGGGFLPTVLHVLALVVIGFALLRAVRCFRSSSSPASRGRGTNRFAWARVVAFLIHCQL